MSVEAVRLVWDILMDIVGLSLFFLQIIVLWRVWMWFVHERKPGASMQPMAPFVIWRRLYCRHRSGYAKAKNQWGHETVMCVRCSKDMNAGKRAEDRI